MVGLGALTARCGLLLFALLYLWMVQAEQQDKLKRLERQQGNDRRELDELQQSQASSEEVIQEAQAIIDTDTATLEKVVHLCLARDWSGCLATCSPLPAPVPSPPSIHQLRKAQAADKQRIKELTANVEQLDKQVCVLLLLLPTVCLRCSSPWLCCPHLTRVALTRAAWRSSRARLQL